MYTKVFVEKGTGGWGTGFTLLPSGKKNKIVSVTGGGIHPVAQKIAELTGGEAVDGFKSSVPEEETVCVVIDCGGTARIGVYPMKKIMTVDVLPSSPSGPLAKHITEDVFVSGVAENNIKLIEGKNEEEGKKKEIALSAESVDFQEKLEQAKLEYQQPVGTRPNIFIYISKVIGKAMGVFYQAGRDTINILIRNILPFIAFVSMLMGVIEYTGIGKLIAKILVPLSGSIIGLVVLAFICSLPILSPVLAPGAVIAQVIGVLIGTQIAVGTLPVYYALPALFAINVQVGCDFIPVGLSLGEAKKETIEIGVPAVLYSRVITGALSVIIAWLFSLGLYV